MPPRINVLLPSSPRPRVQRGLSTTSSRLALVRNAKKTNTTKTPKGQIPPESPRYIEIPKSLQPQSIYRPWVKGVLPVPRKIFRRSDPKDKTSKEYLSAVTPDPKSPRAEQTNSVANSQLDALYTTTWKSQQSAARRRNLREGLVELHQRKQQIDRSKAHRRARKQAESFQLANAPEREDERLTNPTVHTALLLSHRRLLPDPNRAQRLKKMRANVESMERKKLEERRLMLHTLYMNAHNFIVRPAQLDQAIDLAFDDPKQFLSDDLQGENIWHMGPPETIQQLLRLSNRAWKSAAVDRFGRLKDLTERRLDSIGEELTGGKM